MDINRKQKNSFVSGFILLLFLRAMSCTLKSSAGCQQTTSIWRIRSAHPLTRPTHTWQQLKARDQIITPLVCCILQLYITYLFHFFILSFSSLQRKEEKSKLSSMCAEIFFLLKQEKKEIHKEKIFFMLNTFSVQLCTYINESLSVRMPTPVPRRLRNPFDPLLVDGTHIPHTS